MRILIVKLSSLGDVVHTLPAVTDAARAIPGLRADWAVEPGFAAIPARHPAVDRVIPLPLRRLRRQPLHRRNWQELLQGHRALRAQPYDLIIDAQGLYKSALISTVGHGDRAGLSRRSAREPLAALGYHHRIEVDPDLHAIERVRRLFAAALGYARPIDPPDYGLRQDPLGDPKQLVFLHGTTWPSKHYPDPAWAEVIALAEADGYRVALPWGNAEEKARAAALAHAGKRSEVLPALSLAALMDVIAAAGGLITVDSGLGHLACALGRPVIGIYGATDSRLTGLQGSRGVNLQAQWPCSPCRQRTCRQLAAPNALPPCYTTLPPELIWSRFKAQMTGSD
ncbi:MAG TPA: lipopolysaccharide heptosyltransferase I [Candidatus Acidoferrales bacterium]|nr:lipopolysaccharide heptosyltransferase I [Candidatus Acidoferrales bacterium]